MDVSAGALSMASTSFPLEVGETVTIKASYSPFSASVDFGLVDSDGLFHYVNVTNGSIDRTIEINQRGNYKIFVYYANVYYQKNIDVNGEIVYSPYKTDDYDVAVGYEIEVIKTGENIRGDYNSSNRDLVNKGIDIYINQYT